MISEVQLGTKCPRWVVIKLHLFSPSQVVQLVGVSPCTPKSCGFDFWSGYIPRLQIRFWVEARTGGNRCFSLPPFLSLSQINKHILEWRLKQKLHLCKAVLGDSPPQVGTCEGGHEPALRPSEWWCNPCRLFVHNPASLVPGDGALLSRPLPQTTATSLLEFSEYGLCGSLIKWI